MKKSTYKNKKVQAKDKNLDSHLEYRDLLQTLLSRTILSKFEVNKRIKIEVIANEMIDLEIDLHRLTTEHTEKILSKLLNSRALNIKTITLIHGFNRGVILKEYLKYDYNSDRISGKINESTNEGITILEIKPWDKNKSKDGQIKKKKQKSENREFGNKRVSGIEEEKNIARFKLEMIKENVKATQIKSKKYSYEFSSVLTDEEKQYSEEIFNYSFDLNFFINNLLEFCVFEETIYIRIRYKKKTIDELISLVRKIADHKADKKFVIIIEVGKVLIKKMKKANYLDFEDYFEYKLEEDSLVISNLSL